LLLILTLTDPGADTGADKRPGIPSATRRLTTWWPSRSKARESIQQAGALVGNAVKTLCPEYTNELVVSGAPRRW